MTTLNTKIQKVPKEYRNKRIYHGGVISVTTKVGGGGDVGGIYTAGNGITINAGEIALDTKFIEVTPDEGVQLKYNNITELEVISGGIDIKNTLKTDVLTEHTVDAGILIPCQLGVDNNVLVNGQLGVGSAPFSSSAGTFKGASTADKWHNTIVAYDNRVLAAGIGGGISFGGIYTDVDGYTVGGFVKIQKENAVSGEYGYNMLLGNRIHEGSAVAQMMIAASDGRVRINQSMDSMDTTFQSGFTGKGWKINKTGSGESATYGLEVDSLRVRGSMTVYELIVNQIRATNGSLWVSDAARIETSVTGITYDYDITVDTDGGNNSIPFAVNDLLRCEKFDGRNVKYYVLQVKTINTGAGTMECDRVHGISTPTASDSLVRMGNTITTTRQNAIYMTASDSDNPYIDMLVGVNSGTAALGSFSKLRLGNLDGINDTSEGGFGQLSGYGLYAEDVYLKGTIHANAGKIAGWEINTGYIYHYDESNYNGIRLSNLVEAGTGPYGRGLTVLTGEDGVGAGDVKIVGMGQIRKKDTYNDWTTKEYGFEILANPIGSIKHLVRFSKQEAMIAGWKIDFDAICSDLGTKHTDDNYAVGGLTLAADGGIHSKNFYVDTDGEVGIRTKLVRSYILSNTPIFTASAIPSTSSITPDLVKTITLGSDIRQGLTIKIWFEIRVSDGAGMAYGRIYRYRGTTETAVGTVRNSANGINWKNWEENITDWYPGDQIRLKLWVSSGIYTAYAQNFKITGDHAIEVNEVIGF